MLLSPKFSNFEMDFATMMMMNNVMTTTNRFSSGFINKQWQWL